MCRESIEGIFAFQGYRTAKNTQFGRIVPNMYGPRKYIFGSIEACADLTPYGVVVRYPNELAVDDIITKSAIDKAQIIYDFCAVKVSDISNEEEEGRNGV